MYDSTPHPVDIDQSAFLEAASRKTLPAMPHIHARLMSSCSAETVDHETMAALIKREPVLTLRLLSLSYAPGRRTRPPAPSIERSLAEAGIENIRDLVTCSAFETALGDTNLSWEDHRDFWLHAVRCAVMAELLAREAHFHDPGSAYLAGLLHDMGKLVLVVCYPDKYRLAAAALHGDETRLADTSGATAEVLPDGEGLEEIHGDSDHCRAGSWLISRETGASFIADAARYHHAPLEKIETAFPLVQFVYTANLLSQKDSGSQELGRLAAASVFGLDNNQVEAVEMHTAVTLEEICSDLGIHQPPDTPPANLGAAAIYPPLAGHLKTAALASVFTRGLLNAGDNRKIFRNARTGLKLLFHIDEVWFFLHEDDRNALVGQAVEDPAGSDAVAHLSIPMRPLNNLPVYALAKNEMVSSFERPDGIEGSLVDSQLLHFLGTDGLLCLPLATRDKGVGTVVIGIDRHQYPGLKRQGDLLKPALRQVAEALLSNHVLQESERKRYQHTVKALHDRTRKTVHEINNPLGAINNYLRVLETKLSREGMVFDELRIIQDEMHRVIGLLGDLTGKKRDLPAGRNPMDLNATLKDIAGLFQATLRQQGIELHMELDDSAPAADFDKNHLKQIFINLIKNAVEAMTGGGRILLTTEVVAPFSRDDSGSDQKGGRRIKCIVADDGPGVPEEIRQSIFEPHVTSKSSHSGLGLSVARELVERLDGTIECDSQPDVGTCFTIVLPLTGHRSGP